LKPPTENHWCKTSKPPPGNCAAANKTNTESCYDIISTPDPEAADIIEILGILEVIAIGEKRQEKLFIQGREVST
jgi:hypothetical protein